MLLRHWLPSSPWFSIYYCIWAAGTGVKGNIKKKLNHAAVCVIFFVYWLYIYTIGIFLLLTVNKKLKTHEKIKTAFAGRLTPCRSVNMGPEKNCNRKGYRRQRIPTLRNFCS